jgi:energy-coupling factor transporter transmembrane protein EcfT
MDFSKLSSSERNAAIAAAVVVVTGLISIANGWGALMWIALLAGVGALVVIFGAQVMPGVKLPGSTGSLLVLVGAIALLVWIAVLIDEIGFVVDNPINFDTWQFLIGLIAAAALTWLGWQALQSEGGRFQLGTPAGSPTPPATADASASTPAAAAQAGNEPAQAVAPPAASAEAPQPAAQDMAEGDGDEERSPA